MHSLASFLLYLDLPIPEKKALSALPETKERVESSGSRQTGGRPRASRPANLRRRTMDGAEVVGRSDPTATDCS